MSFTASLDEIVENNDSGLLGKGSHWERVLLSAVADVINGFPFDSRKFSKETGVPLVRIRDINSKHTDTLYVGDVPEGFWIELDDVLVGMDGDFNSARWKGPKALLNQRVAKLVFNEKFVSKNFMFHAVGGYLKAVNDNTPSLTVKHLSSRTIKELPMPLPPLAEQKRIADKLDALLARVDAVRARLDRVPALLKRFRQSVLAAATSGQLTKDWRDGQQMGWEECTVGDLSDEVRYGTSKKCSYEIGGVAVLRIPNISEHGRIDASDLKYASFDDKELEMLALRKGDLLVIRSNGSIDLVGKTGLVTKDETGLLFAGYLIRVRSKLDRVMPEFLQICFHEPEQRQRIELTSKSTSGVNNLNADELRALPVKLPPLEEQHEIVRRVEALFALADNVQVKYDAARARIDRLAAALLAKAFRGELVPQDPNDEPASVLLARIRAERAAAPKPARRSRKQP